MFPHDVVRQHLESWTFTPPSDLFETSLLEICGSPSDKTCHLENRLSSLFRVFLSPFPLLSPFSS